MWVDGNQWVNVCVDVLGGLTLMAGVVATLYLVLRGAAAVLLMIFRGKSSPDD